MKKCIKCNFEGDDTLFVNKRNVCKPCMKKIYKQKNVEYYKTHREQIINKVKEYYEENKEKVFEYKKEWQKENREEISKKHKEYYKNNKEALDEKNKIYCKEHREEVNKYKMEWAKKNKKTPIIKEKKIVIRKSAEEIKQKKRLDQKIRTSSDLNFKLARILRSRVYKAIKAGQKAGSAVNDLCCSIAELKQHLESKFKDGMTWQNWTIDGWHIDHIKPLASFDLTNREQFLEACHYTNLQPLWAMDNYKKGDKIL